MSSRREQAAKARFSELLEASITKGPQIVTRRAVEMAVLVPFDQWRRLEETTRPTLKELLLPRLSRYRCEIALSGMAIAIATADESRTPIAAGKTACC